MVGKRPQVRIMSVNRYLSKWLNRSIRDKCHVALKILTAHASREVEEGRLRERDILRTVSSTAPAHHGYNYVLHLSHEFTFESFAGHHICFVTDVLSYSVYRLPFRFFDPRPSLKFILRLTKHVLKGLDYLHDKCKIVHSGIFSLS